ncbi:MAG: hypothetical protein Q4P13_02470 [Psychrobacter sp.]|nr:hypothetical protein [Psychrobacter sp.]
MSQQFNPNKPNHPAITSAAGPLMATVSKTLAMTALFTALGLGMTPALAAPQSASFTQSANKSANNAAVTVLPSSAPSAYLARPDVSVYFLNGIFNTDVQAQTSAIALFNRLKQDPYFLKLVNNKQVNLRTLYNPADPFIGDLIELGEQANIQKSALKATQYRLDSEHLAEIYDTADLAQVRQAIYNEELYKAQQAYQAKKVSSLDFIHNAGNRVIKQYHALADEVRRSLLAGDKVVIVAHSQGNYAVQSIYSELNQDPKVKDLLAKNLSVVGVANVAATTPTASYITNKDDQAVYTWHTLQGGQPMIANFSAIFADGEPLGGAFESKVQQQNDSQNHGFIETYLSARFDDPQNFVPHNPDIIEKSSQNSPKPKTIYAVVVNEVMTGLKRLLA